MHTAPVASAAPSGKGGSAAYYTAALPAQALEDSRFAKLRNSSNVASRILNEVCVLLSAQRAPFSLALLSCLSS